MTETKSRNLPEGAVMLKDGKHFHLKNEKYGNNKEEDNGKDKTA